MAERHYPVGIQTFSEIIRGGYVYIDKTDLVWQMQHKRKYIFLSRPRRFGKSLLSSTLHSFFAGQKELFEGLKIMELEKEWNQYPIIHLDMSTAKGQDSKDELRQTLMWLLQPYTKQYGKDENETTPGKLLTGIIKRVHYSTGKQVVIIIDEYDAPMLEIVHDNEVLDELRKVMQEFYTPLKACEADIRFCFITGITKFSQLSIFSTINNLTNITMWPEFSALCGITEKELSDQMQEDIELMALKNHLSVDEMHAKLKMYYDGYHFSEDSEEVYNPFSLLKAFDSRKLGNYWFESGTPSFLISEMKHFRTDIMSLDQLEVPSTAFDQPSEAMDDALPLLYQSGYLTIKGYNPELDIYTLSIPNQEVRIGYTKGLLPSYTGLKAADVQTGFAAKFWMALKKDDIDLAMREMQAYMAGIPYIEGFKQKLADAATAEGFYEYTMYLIFSMLNVYTKTQVKCAGGRTDVVVWMAETIYVFELKVTSSAEDAVSQIDEKGYAIPFETDGRKVVKVGVKFDKETRTPINWIIHE
jgi:hypothetical protein